MLSDQNFSRSTEIQNKRMSNLDLPTHSPDCNLSNPSAHSLHFRPLQPSIQTQFPLEEHPFDPLLLHLQSEQRSSPIQVRIFQLCSLNELGTKKSYLCMHQQYFWQIQLDTHRIWFLHTHQHKYIGLEHCNFWSQKVNIDKQMIELSVFLYQTRKSQIALELKTLFFKVDLP